MPKLRLTYFDFHGGRGEPARLALTLGGVAFEDRRVALPDWRALKSEMPLGALPVLEVDGYPLTQSNAINRYVGGLTGLYPTDPWQAALCDEVMESVEDISSKVSATFGMTAEARKTQRESLATGPIPLFLARLSDQLRERGDRYFVEDRLTVADLKVFAWVRHLRSGALDHIDAGIVELHAPNLCAHQARVAAEPGIAAWYAAHS
ncbi:MAG: glutathione S-transferase family protein [Myxococcota bacterium]